VRLEDLHFFFRQLYAMMNAGVNPVAALQTLASQTRSPRLAAALLDLRTQALAGKGLAVGMERHRDVFSPLMIAITRAGETGGFLVEAIRRIADYIERDIALRNRIRQVTFYPKLVIVASIVIILVTNAILASLGTPSRLSSPLTSLSTWLILAPLLIGLVLFFRYPAKRRDVQAAIQRLVLRLPWFSSVSHGFAMAKFGRAFGALYRAGVPMPEALHMAADACGNEALRIRILPAAQSLEAGLGVTEAFRRTGAFTPIALDMAAAGEATGSLDETLAKMAEYYEEEGKVRSEQTATVLGVVAFLVVAVYVATIVFGFYASRLQGLMDAAE
jgi:type IV pilus assembly protein PilC/MSHA biogenesis protein MshG